PAPVDLMLEDVSVDKGMEDLAVELIQAESIDFDHAVYFSEYRERLRETLEAMAAGYKPEKPKKAPPKKKDGDLLAALKASVAAASKKEEQKKKPARRRAATAGRNKA